MSSKDLHNHNFSWSSSVSFLWWNILFISIGRLKQILKGDSGFPLCIFFLLMSKTPGLRVLNHFLMNGG